MNTYDPSDRICYVHLSGPASARAAGVAGAIARTTVPAGHADRSPRTRRQRRPASSAGTPAGVASLTA